MALSKPIDPNRFEGYIEGRLTKAIPEDQKGKTYGFTRSELCGLKLSGLPIYLNHQRDLSQPIKTNDSIYVSVNRSNAPASIWKVEGAVGELEGNYVDDEGWLVVYGRIYKDAPHAEVIKTGLLSGTLHSLSIGMLADNLAVKGRVDYQEPKEASLTNDPVETDARIMVLRSKSANKPQRAEDGSQLTERAMLLWQYRYSNTPPAWMLEKARQMKQQQHKKQKKSIRDRVLEKAEQEGREAEVEQMPTPLYPEPNGPVTDEKPRADEPHDPRHAFVRNMPKQPHQPDKNDASSRIRKATVYIEHSKNNNTPASNAHYAKYTELYVGSTKNSGGQNYKNYYQYKPNTDSTSSNSTMSSTSGNNTTNPPAQTGSNAGTAPPSQSANPPKASSSGGSEKPKDLKETKNRNKQQAENDSVDSGDEGYDLKSFLEKQDEGGKTEEYTKAVKSRNRHKQEKRRLAQELAAQQQKLQQYEQFLAEIDKKAAEEEQQYAASNKDFKEKMLGIAQALGKHDEKKPNEALVNKIDKFASRLKNKDFKDFLDAIGSELIKTRSELEQFKSKNRGLERVADMYQNEVVSGGKADTSGDSKKDMKKRTIDDMDADYKAGKRNNIVDDDDDEEEEDVRMSIKQWGAAKKQRQAQQGGRPNPWVSNPYSSMPRNGPREIMVEHSEVSDRFNIKAEDIHVKFPHLRNLDSVKYYASMNPQKYLSSAGPGADGRPKPKQGNAAGTSDVKKDARGN